MAGALTAIALAVAIHLTAMAACALAMGIRVRSLLFGVGPVWLRLGPVHLRALPVAGNVVLKDSRVVGDDGDGEVLDPAGFSDAFNHQPLWKQVLLPLAGLAALVAMGVGILGAEGWAAFLRGFMQVVLGAVSPLDQAQVYLRSVQVFVGNHGFVATLGLVCAKLGALNLLPLATFNGGQALVNMVKRGRPEVAWEQAWGQWSLWCSLLLLGAWVVAFGYLVLP
ncbi:site-2 protease family protein [Acidovorax sp.]|uniref:site-2 protease family protein n=1 Tax=Acidovorax sp. TaxID=1872122 RepID=UPI00391EFB11